MHPGFSAYGGVSGWGLSVFSGSVGRTEKSGNHFFCQPPASSKLPVPLRVSPVRRGTPGSSSGLCPLWAFPAATRKEPEPTLAGRSVGEPENRPPLFLPTSRQTFVALASIKAGSSAQYGGGIGGGDKFVRFVGWTLIMMDSGNKSRNDNGGGGEGVSVSRTLHTLLRCPGPDPGPSRVADAPAQWTGTWAPAFAGAARGGRVAERAENEGTASAGRHWRCAGARRRRCFLMDGTIWCGWW